MNLRRAPRNLKAGQARRLPKLIKHRTKNATMPQLDLNELEDDQLFPVIDVKSLKSRFIDDHPLFVELIQQIESFN